MNINSSADPLVSPQESADFLPPEIAPIPPPAEIAGHDFGVPTVIEPDSTEEKPNLAAEGSLSTPAFQAVQTTSPANEREDSLLSIREPSLAIFSSVVWIGDENTSLTERGSPPALPIDQTTSPENEREDSLLPIRGPSLAIFSPVDWTGDENTCLTERGSPPTLPIDRITSPKNEWEGSLLPKKGTSSSFDTPSLPVDLTASDGFFITEGKHTLGGQKSLSDKYCDRPGCRNIATFEVRARHKRYCSQTCYYAVRLVRKRLLHWHRLTGCQCTWEVYRLLNDVRAGPR